MSEFIDLPSDEQVQAQLLPVRVAVLEATHHVRSPRRSTRYRTTRAVIIAGALAAALTAGTIAATRANDVRIDTEVTCFEHASLDSLLGVVSFTDDDGTPSADFDPVELCELIWTNHGDAPIPPMAACTLGDGTAGVFPREGSTASADDFCAALGLAEWDSD